MYSGKLKPWFYGTILLFLLVNTPTIVKSHSVHKKLPNIQEENEYKSTNHAHSRQKRLLWITSDGRLALPPGTTLVITPSLSLPFVRYPPDGFFSNMTISLPFTSMYKLKQYQNAIKKNE